MANQQAAVAEVPPHTPKKSNVVDNYKTNSGFEGMEETLGKSLWQWFESTDSVSVRIRPAEGLNNDRTGSMDQCHQ